jgi:hypothetical protein
MKLFLKSHFLSMIFHNQTGYFIDFVLGFLFFDVILFVGFMPM